MLKLVTLAVALALAAASMESHWTMYKQKYNKRYQGDEDVVRRYIWQYNLQLIENHNKLYAAGKSTFYMAENNFTDLNSVEFNKIMNGVKMGKKRAPKPAVSVHVKDLPDTVDWRTKGYVTTVKNQGPCGSCWAFSATGALEAQHFKATGKLVSLSESNLLDCSRQWGNYGCSGGLMDNAFQYIIDNGGIDTEAGYPYYPQESSCYFLETDIGATMSNYKDIPKSETAVQQVVATVGPVSIAIDASHPSFQHYGGGVYDEPECSPEKLDHGVLIVGYGTQNGTDYWLVKNSWGIKWGQDGYIMMSRNKNNQCGIATMASYPIV